MNQSALREQICCVSRSVFERGLAHGSIGNFSARGDDGCLRTPEQADDIGSRYPAG